VTAVVGMADAIRTIQCRERHRCRERDNPPKLANPKGNYHVLQKSSQPPGPPTLPFSLISAAIPVRDLRSRVRFPVGVSAHWPAAVLPAVPAALDRKLMFQRQGFWFNCSYRGS
jgi:hypothetical protein